MTSSFSVGSSWDLWGSEPLSSNTSESFAFHPPLSLEQSETQLDGQVKTAFLNFIRSMLKWVPEERRTAKELLNDPWVNGESERVRDLF
jgi:hypothetical protein